MYAPNVASFVVLLCSTSLGQALLDKPALRPNLDDVQAGLMANLKVPGWTKASWGPGYIPQACKNEAIWAGLDPQKILTYNVKYDDCGEPWVICRHNDSPSPLETLIDRFGRVPVRMRQFTRHIMAFPNPGGTYAFNRGGDVVMFNRLETMALYIHETAHGVDLQGEFYYKPTLSNSQKWLSEYALDSAVPDNYARTNQVENVAQNTVIAVYNENVPGQFYGIEPNAGRIFHQYATVMTVGRDAGRLLNDDGFCTRRLANSPAVLIAASRIMMATSAKEKPNVNFTTGIEVIPAKDFDTSEACKHAFGIK